MQFGHFALAGIATLLIVGVATAIASRRVGEREAIADARTTTLLKAEGVMRPLVTAELLRGDGAARRQIDRIVRRDVLDDSLVRVKLWREDGTIVYSDEAALIGTRELLDDEKRESLRTGLITAETSDLSKSENTYERSFGRLVEVYLPIRAQTGERVLFEAYYRADVVDAKGGQLWRSFAPISLGALVMLQLVQLPLAWSLTRRLRERLLERELLLSRALRASEVERRQIASDLHDGAVQELAGVAYALSGTAMRGDERPEITDLLTSSAETVRTTIKELRSLIVDIYPPDFDDVPFDSALADLLGRARDRGLDTSLRIEPPDATIADAAARLLFRAAQEGVRNVLAHAEASNVRIEVRLDAATASLDVIDDGRGIAGDLGGKRASGHLGLTALRGLVADAGGALTVEPVEPRGTRLRVEVPA